MGRLLERLLSNAERALAAIPANSANLAPLAGPIFADSQDSRGGDTEKAKARRALLLAMADDEGLAAELVHGLDDADVSACAGLPRVTLSAYLHALEVGRRMDAGVVPPDWGEPVARTCEGCGPVLLWQGCPPTVKACPWCFRRKAGRAIPRPMVACGRCRHYLPDPLNPAAGMGGCALGAGRALWPVQEHRCLDWRARDE